MGLLRCQRYFARCNHVLKPKRPIIVRQEFDILVAVYWAVRRLTECIEKVMLHCFISRYKHLSALTRTMDHQRLGSATWVSWGQAATAASLMHMSLQPSNVSRTTLILLSFTIMCHWNVLAFTLSERNLGLTSYRSPPLWVSVSRCESRHFLSYRVL